MEKDKNNIKEENLKKVTGGEAEPEEFDWRSKGYVTPVKDQTSNPDAWPFEPIEDNNKK